MTTSRHTRAAAALLAGGLVTSTLALGASASAATHSSAATHLSAAAHARATHSAKPAASSCSGSVGVEAPITGAVAVIGLQQLHWAQYAATLYNKANGTDFKVIPEDTEFEPAQATVVTQDLVSNSSVLDVVGPSSSAEVEAVGPIMAANNLAFISASATADSLFSGKYPTFFSVVAKNGQEGPYNASFIAHTLGATHVEVIDDESGYSVELAHLAEATFTRLHVTYTTAAVSQTDIDYAAVIAKIPSDVTVVYLPWQVAGNAELFAQQLVSAHRKLIIVGSDGVSSPSEFYANGDYVTAFSPDITEDASDASLIKNYLATYHGSVGTYGPPEYVAMQAALSAISLACKSGTPTRASVLAAMRKVDLPTSLEGVAIRFNKYGLLVTARFYMFKVVNKKYVEVS